MILERLTIENLFCYYGEQSFDLAPPPGAPRERNLLIVEGRNGFGKTSFLNSLKLLFGGVTDDLRAQALARPDGPASRRVTLPHNRYVWGDDSALWSGVLNTRAVAEGQRRYGVRGLLLDEGRRVEITRTWERTPLRGARDYEGTLEIRVESRPMLDRQDQEDLLHDLLPREAIPYFFFDAELIQEIALLEGPELDQAVRRLLDIHSLERLGDAAASRHNAWLRESADAEQRRRLGELEAEQARLRQEREGAASELARLKEELATLESRRAARSREQEQLRGRGLEVDQEALARAEHEARQALQQAVQTLLDQELPLAPLRLPAPLLARTQQALDEVLRPPERPREAEARVIRGLVQNLPPAVFDMGAEPEEPLSEAQRDFYRSKLRRQLEGCLPPPGEAARSALLGGLSAVGAGYVRELLDGLGGPLGERALGEAVERAREARSRLAARREERDRLRGASEHDRARWRQLADEILELSEKIGALRDQRIPSVQNQQRGASQRLTEIANEIRGVQEEIARRAALARPAALAGRVERLLRRLAEQSRARRRVELEEHLNTFFGVLFSSTAQIDRLSLDDQLRIKVQDRAGRPLGKVNLSAGTRQLVAVSFLWALTRVMGRELPVAIDTPIARLDREHQEAILTEYLKEVSRQVLLLPTDSELTPERALALRPRTYRHIRLQSVDRGRSVLETVWEWAPEGDR